MAALDARARALLTEGRNFATVSTLRADGTIQANVAWVDADEQHVVLNSAEGRGWPANLATDPRVTVAVYNHDDPYEYVQVRGRVAERAHEGADAHIDAMAKKYFDVDEYPSRRPGEQRVIFRIAPEHVTYRAARG